MNTIDMFYPCCCLLMNTIDMDDVLSSISIVFISKKTTNLLKLDDRTYLNSNKDDNGTTGGNKLGHCYKLNK